jgi:biotin operon repressor
VSDIGLSPSQKQALILAAAEDHIAAGRAITPVWGKAPRLPGWRESGASLHAIRAALAAGASGFGFLGGPLNHGIGAIDFDSPAGEAWWRAQCEANGIDPDDFPTVITPGKILKDGTWRGPGKHIYGCDVHGTLGNRQGRTLRELGIDLRFNGQTVLPPAPHPDGTGEYRYAEGRGFEDFADGIPAIPEFIDDAVEEEQSAPKTGNGTVSSDARITGYCSATLASTGAELAAVTANRNIALNTSALKLAKLAHYGVYDHNAAWDVLCNACVANGLLAEDGARACAATFTSGWNAGLADPKQISDESADSPAPDVDIPPDLHNTAELVQEQLPALEWCVEGLIPIGLTLFIGKPKTCKSWLALAIAIACALGLLTLGKYLTRRCSVLLFSLEDTPRRLQSRLLKLLGTEPAPENLFYAFDLPAGSDCIKALEAQLDRHPDCKLIIIDPFARIRGAAEGRKNAFQQDYADVGALQNFANRRNIALLVIHHARKADASDPLDAVNGTTGFAGAADTLLVLTRNRGEATATLSVTGKDIEDPGDLALTWDPATCRWTVLGEASFVRQETLQDRIFKFLHEREDPISAAEIADELSIGRVTVKGTLNRLKKRGAVESTGRGRWRVRL